MIRKSHVRSLVSRAALAAVLALSVPFSTAAASTSVTPVPSKEGIRIILNGAEFQLKTAPFIDKGTVYMPVRDIGELLGTVVFWHSTIKTVTMTYPELTVRLKYGTTIATVNGKPKELSASLRIVNERIYIPIRFFSETAGADVKWDRSTHTVSITKSDKYVMGGGSNTIIWLNRESRDLYIAHPYEQAPEIVGKIDTDLRGAVSISEGGMNSKNRIVTVVDNYGEPRIHYDTYSVLVHNNKIVSQKKASYFQRYEQNLSYFQYYDPNGWIQNMVLTDGSTLTIFNEEGKAVKEYNLPALVGKDEVYSVLGVGENFLVVRPNQTGFLTLINLEDNSTVELYDKLLSGKDLEYARNNDVPYHGDMITFMGADWTEEELYFMYKSPFESKDRENIRLTYRRHSVD